MGDGRWEMGRQLLSSFLLLPSYFLLFPEGGDVFEQLRGVGAALSCGGGYAMAIQRAREARPDLRW
jgi:hypothetical protein